MLLENFVVVWGWGYVVLVDEFHVGCHLCLGLWLGWLLGILYVGHDDN